MSVVTRVDTNHKIKYDPEPEDVGTIRVNARIFREVNIVTFTTLSFANEFINDDRNECHSRVDLIEFLKEAGISDNDTADTMYHFIRNVAEITCYASPGCAFEVWLDLLVLDQSHNTDGTVQISLDYEIKHNPEPEDACTVRVHPRIICEGGDILTLTTYKFTIKDDGIERQTEVEFINFLKEAGIRKHHIRHAMYQILYVAEVTCTASDGFSPGCALEVWLDFEFNEDVFQTEEEVQIEEAVRVSLESASKVVVKSLARKMYEKVSSTGETCAICLEEFKDESRVVVTLPCGHDFDDECALKWFEINHVCPLCRFELPCEDQ